MDKCVWCRKSITKSEGADGLWYHSVSGLPPCNPDQVDPEAYRDDEGDKYPIATLAVTLHHIPVHDCQENVREIARLRKEVERLLDPCYCSSTPHENHSQLIVCRTTTGRQGAWRQKQKSARCA